MNEIADKMQAELERNKTPFKGDAMRNAKCQPGDSGNTALSVPASNTQENKKDVSGDGVTTNTEMLKDNVIEIYKKFHPNLDLVEAVHDALPETNDIAKEEEYSDIDVIGQPTINNNSGYTQPAGQRNERTRDMTPADLTRRVRGAGVTWHQTPEYAEQIYRLQTLTIEQLEESGHTIPMWRKALEK